MKRIVLALVVAMAGLGLLLPQFLGCKQQANSGSDENPASENVLWRSELFDYAIDSLLNRTDEYNSAERQQQTINRLDQWVRLQKPLEGWKPDPVIAGVTEDLKAGSEQVLELAQQIAKLQQNQEAGPLNDLPARFRSAAERLNTSGRRLALMDLIQFSSQMATMADQLQQVLDQAGSAPKQTEAMRTAFGEFNLEHFALLGAQVRLLAQRIDPSILEFPPMDSPVFQEAVWMRNVSNWASGEELDDPVKPAIALFDWVVKNVDLIREPKPDPQNGSVRVLQTPMETLLFGQGTGIDRAWLFVLLARQMNMDAALLGLADENNNLTRLWGVGVLIDGEIYLFEPVLGLPIPKPGSMKMTEDGMTFELATLTEAAENEAVFEQLDVLKSGSYAVLAKDMHRTVALVEASPSYLSQRMKMVEKRLSGDQKIVLTTDTTAQIERFKKCKYVVGGQMWPLPYQTIWQEIRLGAERQQWLSRRLKPFLFPPEAALLWQARSYYFKGQFTGSPSATMFYQAARRSDFSMDSNNAGEQDKQQWQEIKIDASYWLGLLVAETGNYRSAEDYLKTRVLMADPGGKWEYGATYNLARVAEATGDTAMAIKLYQIHLSAPQTQGNLIRARWLMELTGQDKLTPKSDASPKEDQEESTEGGKAEKASEGDAKDMKATPEGEEKEEPKADKKAQASEEPAGEAKEPKPETKEADQPPGEPKAEKQSKETPEKADAETPATKAEASAGESKEKTPPAQEAKPAEKVEKEVPPAKDEEKPATEEKQE